MAIANDSIYVNIIAKTQDAISGINQFMRTITLAGSSMYAFRVAMRAVSNTINDTIK